MVLTHGANRRSFLRCLASFGLVGASADALWAAAEQGPLSSELLAAAERLAGLQFSEAERDMMLAAVGELTESYEKIRAVPLGNEVSPALVFRPAVPDYAAAWEQRPVLRGRVAPPALPADPEELAFMPVTHLSQLIRTRQVSSLALTEMFLARLVRLNSQLECVVSLTDKRALEQARRADRELAQGIYRGPLHGIPWGAKDLLAVRGYPTTWGAMPFKDQVLDEDATVVRRLDEAGAVLIAKLTLGALAMGDVWFGGKTRNPWNLEQGSSGSSAGPAAAVAAGAVAFAIGSETRGSILSPCTRCGVTGLRPTFGRVSRHGAMALSWSMDKIGPICRTAEDCAVVLAAIGGADGCDDTVLDVPFNWEAELDVRRLRVGCVESAFAAEREGQEEWKAFDLATLDTVRSLGVELAPIELPDLPIDALSFVLSVEAAAAFDDLTRSNRDDELVRQDNRAWPNRLRQARMVPAVEYLQANRVRRLAMREMDNILAGFDAYISPTYGGDNLLLTNLTGHPAVVLPNGFREDGTPTSITFIGNLFRDAEALSLARAYQETTNFHRRHPPLEV